MATTLIITSGKSKNDIDSRERFAYVQDFCDAVEAKLTDMRVCFTTYEDIITTIKNGNVAMYDTRNHFDLQEAVVVHFKNWINDLQVAGMTARYLERAGVGVYNSEVANVPARTKAAQMALLASSGITVPDSFFAEKSHLRKLFSDKKLPEDIHFPFIMKANDGAKGSDNYLITSFSQALSIVETAKEELEFILQAYHKNEGDYRFLYVGLEEAPMVFHRKGSADTHLNNTSKGGTGTLLTESEVPGEYYEIARRAAQITGREIGGVDILVDVNTHVPYVLEVNQTPALATGYDVELKVKKFAELIERHVVSEEE